MEDLGVRYSRIRIVKTFSGDVEAHSNVEMLWCRRERWCRLRGSGTNNGFRARQVGQLRGLARRDDGRRGPVGQMAGRPRIRYRRSRRISGEGRIEIAHDGGHEPHLDYASPDPSALPKDPKRTQTGRSDEMNWICR